MSEFSENKSTFFVKQGSLFPAVDEQALPPINPSLWQRLARSEFRRQFHLNAQDRAYLAEKGLDNVLEHGVDFIARRLAPAKPTKDGRQTPWQGHPVFVAQHATGTCCRSCLEKWHGLIKGFPLNQPQQTYVLAVIAGWLKQEEQTPLPLPSNTTSRAPYKKSTKKRAKPETAP